MVKDTNADIAQHVLDRVTEAASRDAPLEDLLAIALEASHRSHDVLEQALRAVERRASKVDRLARERSKHALELARQTCSRHS
jgi:hypothetical protein